MNIEYIVGLAVTFIMGVVEGHMKMKYPAPRGDPNAPYTGPADYNLSSPIPSAQAMCHNKPQGQVSGTFRGNYKPNGLLIRLIAGESVPVQFDGSARHGGGLCQFALSYDGGSTFSVIQEILGACPNCKLLQFGQFNFCLAAYTWPVKLPDNLPSCERCIFAWTWINAVGNREYYMNCADVKIVGSSGASNIRGRSLFIANLPGFSVYTPPVHDGGPAESTVQYFGISAA